MQWRWADKQINGLYTGIPTDSLLKMHENPGEDCILGVFYAPLKAAMKTSPILSGGRRPFLSLGSRDTGPSRRFGLFWRWVCVKTPNFGHLQDLVLSPRRLNRIRVDEKKTYPHDFVGDGDGKVSLLVCLWCYYVITSLFPVPNGFSLLEDACSLSVFHTQLQAPKETKDEYVQYIVNAFMNLEMACCISLIFRPCTGKSGFIIQPTRFEQGNPPWKYHFWPDHLVMGRQLSFWDGGLFSGANFTFLGGRWWPWVHGCAKWMRFFRRFRAPNLDSHSEQVWRNGWEQFSYLLRSRPFWFPFAKKCLSFFVGQHSLETNHPFNQVFLNRQPFFRTPRRVFWKAVLFNQGPYTAMVHPATMPLGPRWKRQTTGRKKQFVTD